MQTKRAAAAAAAEGCGSLTSRAWGPSCFKGEEKKGDGSRARSSSLALTRGKVHSSPGGAVLSPSQHMGELESGGKKILSDLVVTQGTTGPENVWDVVLSWRGR